MESTQPEQLRRFIQKLLDTAGPQVAEAFGTTGPLRFKTGREAITEVDGRIESWLSQQILASYPDHCIHGEEHGIQGSSSSAWQWFLDPIDGTLNFAIGVPIFSLSVAVAHHGQILAGGVMDPLRSELFTAARGGGAYLGEAPIQVSDRPTLDHAIASTQVSRGSVFVSRDRLLQDILTQTLKTRRLGTIALELAYVAMGRFDLLFAGKEVPQNLYDVAAGVLLVAEAGGQVTNLSGQPFTDGGAELLASNGLVHAAALDLVSAHLGPAPSP